MIILTEENKKYIKESELKGNIKIDGVEYFYKVYTDGLKYSEIIAEKALKILGIRCAHYDAAKIDDDIYLFSEHLNTKGKILIEKNFSDVSNSLYAIWNMLENFYGNAEDAMDDLIKIYLFDILFMNSDRNIGNFLIVKENDRKIRIYAIDNEFILDPDCDVTLTSCDENNDYYYGHDATFNIDLTIKKNMKELEKFLKESTLEVNDFFRKMIETLTPEVFENIISKVEIEVNDSIDEKDMYINMYKKNYEAIKALLESRGKDGKRIH